ncbi:STAS domain-containing protein [Streptomyces massasporeus]|uniref:STAS domain-containing protein n=1 Tax=Streptomyces massasporeus TaxID=67324 RepID=UPI0036EE5A84
MTVEPPPPPTVVIDEIDDRNAKVTLTGDFGARLLRDLEERLDDPRWHAAKHWIMDLRDVHRIDLACAYALLGAVTRHSGTATVRCARRTVLRTLRDAGLDRATVIEE